MRKFPSRRLFAISLATAAAFAMTACTDDDDDTDTNDDSDSSETDDDDAADDDSNDDTASDAGLLSDEEFIQCTYLGIDFVQVGADLSTLPESEIQDLADSAESYTELADHTDIHASATDIAAMLNEAAGDPSAYSAGSEGMVDLTEEIANFADICASNSPEDIE